MTAPHVPVLKPGRPLTAETVGLVKRGDWLQVVEHGMACAGPGDVMVADNVSCDLVFCHKPNDPDFVWQRIPPSRFAWLGRPDADGWIAHNGGKNPVAGMRVNVRQRGYIRDDQSSWLADNQRWSHNDGASDITHWRPHVPAQSVADKRAEALSELAALDGETMDLAPLDEGEAGERETLIADLEALLAAEPVFVVGHPISRAILALRSSTPSTRADYDSSDMKGWVSEILKRNGVVDADYSLTRSLVAAFEKTRASTRAEAEPVAWRPVVGFEGYYEVSTEGRIRRTDTGKVLSSSSLAGMGYVKVDLWREGKRTQTTAHRVVAKAFLPPVEGLDEVNHKDGDKTNNRLENLEWSDRRANTDHSRYVLGNDVKAVIATDEVSGEEIYFPSIGEAGRNGFNANCISEVVAGRRRQHGGKTWRTTEFRPPESQPAADADKLREALKPFADIGADYRSGGLRQDIESRSPDFIRRLNHMDFRRADQVLNEGAKS